MALWGKIELKCFTMISRCCISICSITLLVSALSCFFLFNCNLVLTIFTFFGNWGAYYGGVAVKTPEKFKFSVAGNILLSIIYIVLFIMQLTANESPNTTSIAQIQCIGGSGLAGVVLDQQLQFMCDPGVPYSSILVYFYSVSALICLFLAKIAWYHIPPPKDPQSPRGEHSPRQRSPRHASPRSNSPRGQNSPRQRSPRVIPQE